MAQNTTIAIKLKAGPFLDKSTIIVTASIRTKANTILETGDLLWVNKIMGPADRRINEVAAGRGFLIEDGSKIPSELLKSKTK